MPDKDVIGLSKFNRTVSHIAQRPHIQEEMTLAIADAVEKACNSKNVAVLVKATHCCMLCRGVQAAEPSFSTPIMRGAFKKSSLRSEFYSLVNLKG
jgi:GTP cyclohydrolase I